MGVWRWPKPRTAQTCPSWRFKVANKQKAQDWPSLPFDCGTHPKAPKTVQIELSGRPKHTWPQNWLSQVFQRGPNPRGPKTSQVGFFGVSQFNNITTTLPAIHWCFIQNHWTPDSSKVEFLGHKQQRGTKTGQRGCDGVVESQGTPILSILGFLSMFLPDVMHLGVLECLVNNV